MRSAPISNNTNIFFLHKVAVLVHTIGYQLSEGAANVDPKYMNFFLSFFLAHGYM